MIIEREIELTEAEILNAVLAIKSPLDKMRALNGLLSQITDEELNKIKDLGLMKVIARQVDAVSDAIQAYQKKMLQ
jgi:hypothetical protein